MSAEQIDVFVAGLADGSLPAEQVSALAMAVFLNGMAFDEAAALTLAMARSGTVLDWSDADLDGPVVAAVGCRVRAWKGRPGLAAPLAARRGWLSAGEQKRAERFHFARDARRFAAEPSTQGV